MTMRKALIVSLIGGLCLSEAYAQERARVRGGEHGMYSRIVLDLGKAVQYNLSQSASELTLSFQTPIEFDLSGVGETPLENIQSISYQNGAQPTVSIVVPDGSRVRDFVVGGRIVVDVYDAEGQQSGDAALPKIVEKGGGDQEQAEQSETKEFEQVKAELRDSELKADVVKDVAAAMELKTPLEKARDALREILEEDVKVDVIGEEKPPAEVEKETAEEDLNREKSKSEIQKLKESIEKVGTNLISISSTSTAGLAVFRKDGEIWMVNDQPDLLISPQISGPNANYFSPLRSQTLPDGKLYQTYDLENSELQVQGGGLVWRVIISGEENDERATKPIRENVVEGQSRGGKMVWPLEDVNTILDVPDPVSGRVMKVVIVNQAEVFSGPAMEFVDFKLLESAAGMAILPKVDDLEVVKTQAGIEVSRPNGLAVSSKELVSAAFSNKMNEELAQGDAKASQRVYDFKSWQLGDISELSENQSIILSTLPGMTLDGQVEGLLTLAKMYLSHGMWSEALGFIKYAESELPELRQNPEFIALEGAAQALGYKSEDAFNLLSSPKLKDIDEIGYWRSYVLADLGDWQQATEVLPKTVEVLRTYPSHVINRLGLGIAEVALRSGDVKQAEKILNIVEEHQDEFFLEQQAAYEYLRGEAARQKGAPDKTVELWKPLTTGKDDLYRAKAGLAMTRLQAERNKISLAETIDNLERLRYNWRGDELEAQISYWLGKTYFDAGAYVKGLNIMREAAGFAAGLDLGRSIAREMTEIFSQLLLDPDPKKLPPVEAAALYEQFEELIPPGEQGDKVVQKLAEHLVTGEVLGRAAQLLQRQVDHRLQGVDGYDAATRLTAIYLLDDQVTPAAKALNKAFNFYKSLPQEEQTKAREVELNLLKARTLAAQGRPDQAIALLRGMERSKNVNRLWAGIAWEAAYWDDAAEALIDVIADQNISLTRPLSDENAMLILQRAVALNLASDRIGLANLREKYTESMDQTDKARIFEVITRPRQSAALADRETLLSIVSEVDLFGEFLNNYKSALSPSN